MAAVYRDASGATISQAEFFRRSQVLINKYGANSPQLLNFQMRWRSAASGVAPAPSSAAARQGIAPAPNPALLDPGQSAVAPHLTPEQQQGRIADTYDYASGRTIADSDWLQVTDPAVIGAKRAQIIDSYNHAARSQLESLAARGLSARGYQAADLWDVERSRTLAEEDLQNAVRLANTRHTATISNLDERKTASDLNYAAMEGQNARAYVPPTYAQPAPRPAAPAPRPAVGNAPNTVAGAPSGPKPGDHYVWSPQQNRWQYTGPSPGANYKWSGAAWVRK